MAEKRKLGSSDLSVTAVGLGCMDFSHAYGAPTEKSEAVKMIRKAYDMGYDFFDTAECYTGTNADGSTSFNEESVGEALSNVLLWVCCSHMIREKRPMKIFNNWNTDYYYNNIHTKNGGKASDCIKCGKCEQICPQHLEIRRLLTDVAKEFDK